MVHLKCGLILGLMAGLCFAADTKQVYSNLDYSLHLGGTRFDPLFESNGLALEWLGGNGAASDLYLVQFKQRAAEDRLSQLKANGLQPVAYLFPLTYVVWGTRQACDRIGRNQAVRWSGFFEPGYRLLPAYRDLSGAEARFRALFYLGAKREALFASLKILGAHSVTWRQVDSRWAIAEFWLAGTALGHAARLPGVMSLQPMPQDGGIRGEMAAQLLAGELDMGGTIQPGYLNWLNGSGLSGQGVVMAVVDDGVDENHPALNPRELPCIGEACAGMTRNNHGTHVAGGALGDASGGVTDPDGFLQALGVAPAAEYVDLLQVNHEKPGGMLTLMTQAVRNGAVLSNNSWGASSQALGYDMDTMLVDIGVRDADPQMAGNQPLTYVLAINNGNGQFQSQGTPDEAKNLIAVGATILQESIGGQSAELDDLAGVTAHGPARDGRILPHLVAPGCRVDGPILQAMYQLRCGTSFAAPQVAGAAALFIENYRNLQGAGDGVLDPSPALVKAALLASSLNLEGRRDARGQVMGPRPDSMQGWGRPHLPDLLGATPVKTYYDSPVIFENSQAVWSMPLQVVDPSAPAQISLVWTDAPGHGLGGATPAWNNDLDLEVDYQGDTYLGNQVGVGGWSQLGGTADFRNNAEGVWLGPTATGMVDVRVRATHIAWDGLPQMGGSTDQDFALVATNLEEQTTFRLKASNPRPSLCLPGMTSIDLALTSFGGFAETVTMSVTGLPANLSTQFSSDSIVPPGQLQLSFQTTGPVSAGDYPIEIVGMSSGGTQMEAVVLVVFDQVPAMAPPLVPAHLSNNHLLQPVFSWQAAIQGETYQVQVAEDVTFTQVVFDEVVEALAFEPPSRLMPFTRYFWRVRGMNACGVGPWSSPSRFRTRLVPPILLVDDDGDAPDVRAGFTEVLDGLDQKYDIWDTLNSTNEPELEDLAPYQLVIWFSGAATNFSDPKAGPTLTSENTLAAYLDGGGCLWLSAQEYLYDRGGPTHNVPTQFMRDYLGVDIGISDVVQGSVTGEGPVFGHLGTHNLNAPFPNQSDRLSPDKNANLAFSGDVGDAGIYKITDNYRTFYWGFSLVALPVLVRQQAVAAILATCPFQFPPGCLDIQDLWQQASSWPLSNNVLDLLDCMDQYSGKRR